MPNISYTSYCIIQSWANQLQTRSKIYLNVVFVRRNSPIQECYLAFIRFCFKCIEQLGAARSVPDESMHCPVCRQVFEIPTAGFSGLKKNFFHSEYAGYEQIHYGAHAVEKVRIVFRLWQD